MVSHDRYGMFRPVMAQGSDEPVNERWKTSFSLHWDVSRCMSAGDFFLEPLAFLLVCTTPVYVSLYVLIWLWQHSILLLLLARCWAQLYNVCKHQTYHTVFCVVTLPLQLNPWRHSLDDEIYKAGAAAAQEKMDEMTYEGSESFFEENNEVGTDAEERVS